MVVEPGVPASAEPVPVRLGAEPADRHAHGLLQRHGAPRLPHRRCGEERPAGQSGDHGKSPGIHAVRAVHAALHHDGRHRLEHRQVRQRFRQTGHPHRRAAGGRLPAVRARARSEQQPADRIVRQLQHLPAGAAAAHLPGDGDGGDLAPAGVPVDAAVGLPGRGPDLPHPGGGEAAAADSANGHRVQHPGLRGRGDGRAHAGVPGGRAAAGAGQTVRVAGRGAERRVEAHHGGRPQERDLDVHLRGREDAGHHRPAGHRHVGARRGAAHGPVHRGHGGGDADGVHAERACPAGDPGAGAGHRGRSAPGPGHRKDVGGEPRERRAAYVPVRLGEGGPGLAGAARLAGRALPAHHRLRLRAGLRPDGRSIGGVAGQGRAPGRAGHADAGGPVGHGIGHGACGRQPGGPGPEPGARAHRARPGLVPAGRADLQRRAGAVRPGGLLRRRAGHRRG